MDKQGVAASTQSGRVTKSTMSTVPTKPRPASKEAISIRKSRYQPATGGNGPSERSKKSKVDKSHKPQRASAEKIRMSKERSTYQKVEALSTKTMKEKPRERSKEKTKEERSGGRSTKSKKQNSAEKSFMTLSMEKLAEKLRFSKEDVDEEKTTDGERSEMKKAFMWSMENRDPKAHEQEEWFHGLLPREDINKLLKNDGDFLVRLSEPVHGKGMKFVLSLRWNKRNSHFVIYETNGKYSVEKNKASTVYLLVNMLGMEKKIVSETNGALILSPVMKQDWELSHEQITLGKLLGEGAFGGVYAGELVQGGKTYKAAVKVNKGKETNKKVIKEICKEARIMRRYQNENVVKFYGVAVAREPIMLVMEMVDGGALDSLLKAKKPETTLHDKLRYATGASRGLEYLHSQICIHRDVAARNCLVHEGEVKISDFGLSREMSDRAAKYKLKGNDLKVRLPIRWLAPEVLSTASFSFLSDVYSFGILLWEIYSDAATPYTGMTLAEVNSKVRKGLRLTAPEEMPKCVKDIMILHCFPAKPEDRWTMKQIKLALEEYMDSRTDPREVTPPS